MQIDFFSEQQSQSFDDLARSLSPDYSDFKIEERLLFTGHSHQAWPNVTKDGLLEYYDVVSQEVDNKWSVAEEKTEKLRNYLRMYYDDADGAYCLATNTHNLIVSWLSALDYTHKRRIVISDGEFHSIYRQLHRLREEGFEIVEVPMLPFDTFAERFVEACDTNTLAAMLSRVSYQTGLINPDMGKIGVELKTKEIPFLIDDYHGTNVQPISIKDEGLEDAFMLIGGYKYLQWGEGNCFLRYPKDCALRPIVTGWFASFVSKEAVRNPEVYTSYDNKNGLFSSATYEPISQFRAAKVVDFFKEKELTPFRLQEQYQAQTAYMIDLFKGLNANDDIIHLQHTDTAHYHRGGFVAFESPFALQLQQKLLKHNMYTDARGHVLRLGPAPYISKNMIEAGMLCLAKSLEELKK